MRIAPPRPRSHPRGRRRSPPRHQARPASAAPRRAGSAVCVLHATSVHATVASGVFQPDDVGQLRDVRTDVSCDCSRLVRDTPPPALRDRRPSRDRDHDRARGQDGTIRSIRFGSQAVDEFHLLTLARPCRARLAARRETSCSRSRRHACRRHEREPHDRGRTVVAEPRSCRLPEPEHVAGGAGRSPRAQQTAVGVRSVQEEAVAGLLRTGQSLNAPDCGTALARAERFSEFANSSRCFF